MSPESTEGICKKLKYDIAPLATPDQEVAEQEKKFFPRAKLKNLLTKEKIGEVLLCRCPSCRRRQVNLIEEQDLAEWSLQISSQCVLLFSLLVYINCPQFIVSFLQLGYSDNHLDESVDDICTNHLRQRVWPTYDETNRGDSERLANKFREHMHKFAVPVINGDLYSKYDRLTRLPFVNVQPLGKARQDGGIYQEGAFGHVYSFEILDEHKSLPV